MKLRSIANYDISDKRILLRVDFNVIGIVDNMIKNTKKIEETLPSINLLLKNNNKLILVSHSSDSKKSLKPIVPILEKLFINHKIVFINDFTQKEEQNKIQHQQNNEIIFLENIRFYPEEVKNERDFAQKLSSLGDVFVNEAFGESHREYASTLGLTQFLPSYAGLALTNEVETILNAIDSPQHPLTVIIGGSKISTKIKLIQKLLKKADHLLVGGAIANTLLAAQQLPIGRSLYEPEQISIAESILHSPYKNKLHLPVDALIEPHYVNISVSQITPESSIYDIGEQTIKNFSDIIAHSKTIIWNGPLGKFEDKRFAQGTQKIFSAISSNHQAISIVGGGDTIPAIENLSGKDKITHISTGGGAMLKLIEEGTLPCLDPLFE